MHSKEEQLYKLAEKNVWIIDVDDTCYRLDSGAHNHNKDFQVKDANTNPEMRKMAKEWVGEDRDYVNDDLGIIFPYFIAHYYNQGKDALTDYLQRAYPDTCYELMKPDPDLVNAFYEAEAKGIELYFHTNGPSSCEKGVDMHTQKVLRAIGCSDDFIDRHRNKTYDVIMSTEVGVGKPKLEGFENACDYFGIDPRDAIYFDDGIKNLLPAIELGMSGVWTFTSYEATPKIEDQAKANIKDIYMSTNTGEAMQSILSYYQELLPKRYINMNFGL